MLPATEESLENDIGIIYLIKNKIDGKVYVGQTQKTFCERYKSINIFYRNKHLRSALKKYGIENIEIYILQKNLNRKELDTYERFYIAMFCSNNDNYGYNFTSGGSNNFKISKNALIEKCRKRTHKLNDVINSFTTKHGDKYDYSLITEENYKNKIHTVNIICKRCGCIFKLTPMLHIRGYGCRKCNVKKRGETDKINNSEPFKKRLEKIFKDKYDLSQLNYTGFKNKCSIICYKHGKQERTCKDLIRGFGCKKCREETLFRTFKESINEIMPLIDGRYEYFDDTYHGWTKKMKFQCLKCKKFFFQSPKGLSQTVNGCLCRLKKSVAIVKIDLSNGATIKEYVSVKSANRERFARKGGSPNFLSNMIKNHGFLEEDGFLYKKVNQV